MSPVTEAVFEAHIAGWLVEHGGYRRAKIGNVGDRPRDFDAEAGVDTADLFEFIGATQGSEWARLVDTAYGGEAGRAQSGFMQRLAAELDKRGTVDVLRHGVVDRNITIRLAYVNLLVQGFSNRDGGHRALQRHLVQTLMDHYRRNEEVIGRVRFWVGVQAVVTFVGTALLIGALLALG